jgi:adenylate kinase
VVLLFGGPGAGKGVQAHLLSDALGLPHVTSGELLREQATRQTPLGLTAPQHMLRGELLPDDLVSDVVLARLSEPDAQAGAILDGFPRTLAQALRLDRWLGEHGGAVRKALVLEVPEEVLRERMALRHRADDTPRAAERRLEATASDLPVLLERYTAQPIDGTGSVETVQARIKEALGST